MKKLPQAVDVHVGSRVRMRRMMIGMSQEKLGNALGLTFQQVQKYEKGGNRIGASRLSQIAAILGVPINFFFEGDTPPGASKKEDEAVKLLNAYLASADGLDLAMAFQTIKSPATRKRIVALVQQMAKEAA